MLHLVPLAGFLVICWLYPHGETSGDRYVKDPAYGMEVKMPHASSRWHWPSESTASPSPRHQGLAARDGLKAAAKADVPSLTTFEVVLFGGVAPMTFVSYLSLHQLHVHQPRIMLYSG